MQKWKYFSYIAASTATLLMVVLAVVAIASPQSDNTTGNTDVRGQLSPQKVYQNQNTVEQSVTITEPTTVPQEVFIRRR
ncbi:hypothetical protein HY621_04160 [Candidatus Uhrbacteria bacterium]|nr:hypothetical protein [Candidatus Uhrbacteria bacterium]